MEDIGRVIITGADGYVGSNTVTYFLEHGIPVLAIDIHDNPNNLAAHPLMEYKKIDIFDYDMVRAKIPKGVYDSWIHFAWMGSAGDGRADFDLQLKNVRACVESLKIAKQSGCNRFVAAGSIMEKEVQEAFKNKYTTPGSAYIYGIGKLLAHYLCKLKAAEEEIDLIWPCITNCYGPGEKSPRFINTTIRKALRNEPLVFSPATQNYDFVYVTDVAKAFYLCTQYGTPGYEYIIGSANARPLKEFIMSILEVIGYEGEAQYTLQNITGVSLPVEVFDTKEFETDTGYYAEVSFKEGIKRTCDWIRSQEI